MNEKEKQVINEENCIDILLKQFPNSKPFFFRFQQEDINDESEENNPPPRRRSFYGEISEFSDYVSEILQKNADPQYVKEIFDFMEYLLIEGDAEVKNAVATCFLENILNITPREVQPHTFVPYLGQKSREFCKGWDSYTGVFTEGLWDDDPSKEGKLSS